MAQSLSVAAVEGCDSGTAALQPQQHAGPCHNRCNHPAVALPWAHTLLCCGAVLVQDTFWWVFCTYCHPDGAQGDAANQLFDRLSSTFARLLLSLNPHVKDPFLRHFFDALAQVRACT